MLSYNCVNCVVAAAMQLHCPRNSSSLSTSESEELPPPPPSLPLSAVESFLPLKGLLSNCCSVVEFRSDMFQMNEFKPLTVFKTAVRRKTV